MGGGYGVPSFLSSPSASNNPAGAFPSVPWLSQPTSSGPFQNFIPPLPTNQYGALGGGFTQAPMGGYWNQVAQQMAGPMFGPYGASSLFGSGNPTQPGQPSPILQTQKSGAPNVYVPGYQAPAATSASSSNGAMSPYGNLGALGMLGALSGLSPLSWMGGATPWVGNQPGARIYSKPSMLP